LACGLKILGIVDKPRFNWTEFVLIRTTFSIYAGWVTVASILSTLMLLKTWGMSDADAKSKEAWDFMDFMMFMSEEAWGCVIICFALIFFNVISWGHKNPMYGCVFIWASGAILSQLQNKKPDSEAIIGTVKVVLAAQSVSMGGLIGYLVREEYKKEEFSAINE
jgi:hypothetical protein